MAYLDPQKYEKKWQDVWQKEGVYKISNPTDPDFDTSKPKYYCMDMFPYPSGDGLHVGHPVSYTATDIVSRYKRMKGFNVLHPMGWDAFGLPAEQYAIQTGVHPAITTEKNIATFKKQLQSLGFSYDWSREVNTTDPGYYRWTQWLFKKLYNSWYDEEAEKGRPIEELPLPEELTEPQEIEAYRAKYRLAYLDEIAVWWCSELGTVLANEEVIDGLSERGGYPCERLPLKQWMFRITAYADRLLKDLDLVDWPEETKKQQQEWIGKSQGASLWFALESKEISLESSENWRKNQEGIWQLNVFTTRPDTLYGATYLVLAPEHPLVEDLTTSGQKQEVEEYCKKATQKSDVERSIVTKEKSGVFTGGYAINPLTGKKVPIWVADYVLYHYGTGAIMAVPAHDERDFDFAIAFGLPIVKVLEKPEGEEYAKEIEDFACYTGEGPYVDAPLFEGLSKKEAIEKICQLAQEKGFGEAQTTYRLRDWIFSRQRFWGEPFPVLHGEKGEIVLVEDDQLPVRLPHLEDFKPTGSPEPMLAKAKDWVLVDTPQGEMTRETNTMPNWAGSCWYYLRYMDPKNDKAPWSDKQQQYWLPVDLYIGGREHAVLHLLYTRFWHKVFYDLGMLHCPEPFQKLFHQGMLTAYAYQDRKTKALIPTDQVESQEDGKHLRISDQQEVDRIIAKMSKSLKNVENPDEIIASHGADALRCYEMFMGPLEQSKPWDTQGLEGVFRFLGRVYRLMVDEEGSLLASLKGEDSPDPEVEKELHRCIKKVGGDIERLSLNTAVSAMMIFVKTVHQKGVEKLSVSQAKRFLLLLAPFAPHLSEELWHLLGEGSSIHLEEWPPYEEELLVESEIEMVVQVNGKLRAKMKVGAELGKQELEERAQREVAKYLEDKTVVKVIVVPKRLVNVVVR